MFTFVNVIALNLKLPMVNSSDFTKRLEKILEFYGLSATAFSEKINFNRSTISHLLSGRNKPSLEFVMKVVQTFPEVELYWLLNGKGTFPKTIVDNSEENIVKKISSTPPVSSDDKKNSLSKNEPNASEIDKIVIFYKDGSFKAYNP